MNNTYHPPVSTWDITKSPTFKSKSPIELKVLYGTELPPDRETNPSVWDNLLSFFSLLLQDLSFHPGHLLLPNPTHTNSKLLNLIVPPSLKPPSSHLTEILFQALSGSSLFIPADGLHLPPPPPLPFFSRLWRRVLGYADDVNVYAAEEALRKRVDMLGEVVKQEGWSGSLGIVGIESIAEKLCGGNMKEAEAVLCYASQMREGEKTGSLVEYSDVERGKRRWGWKVGKEEVGDGEVLELVRVLKEGERTVEELGERWKELGRKAVEAKERGDRKGCIGLLKRRKQVEKRRVNGGGIVEKVEKVLAAIEEARRMKGVVVVIGKGVKVAKEQKVLVDRVEAVMEEWDELQEDIETVNRVWETASAEVGSDVSDEVLLEELEELSQQERKEEVLEAEHGRVEETEVEKEKGKISKTESSVKQSEPKNTPRRSAFTISAPVESESESSNEEKRDMAVGIDGELFEVKTGKQSNMIDAVKDNAELVEAVQSLSLEPIPPSVIPERDTTPRSGRIEVKGEDENQSKSSENVKESQFVLS